MAPQAKLPPAPAISSQPAQPLPDYLIETVWDGGFTTKVPAIYFKPRFIYQDSEFPRYNLPITTSQVPSQLPVGASIPCP